MLTVKDAKKRLLLDKEWNENIAGIIERADSATCEELARAKDRIQNYFIPEYTGIGQKNSVKECEGFVALIDKAIREEEQDAARTLASMGNM